MNELITFDYQKSAIRIVERAGDPWFIAADVATLLGYRNAPDMTRNLDDDEADTHIVRSSSQSREMTVISESGLYHAIFKSRREEAKDIRRWVTGTVLPQIRRTGGYGVIELTAPQKMRLVALAARVHSKRAARELWAEFGLPMPMKTARLALDVCVDELFEPVKAYAFEKEAVTINDVLDNIDWHPSWTEHSLAPLRRRIGAILRELNFHPQTMRVRGAVVKVFIWANPESAAD